MNIAPYTIINILIIFILLLFTLLLFNVGRHTRSNSYLGIYFISQIVVLFNMAFHFFSPVWDCILQSIIFSWGAFYYLFVLSLLDHQFVFKPKHLLYFVPIPVGCFFLMVDMVPGIRSYFQTNTPVLAGSARFIHTTLFNLLIIGYNIVTVYKYYQFRKNVKKDKTLLKQVHPVWLNISVWGFVFACVVVQIGRQMYQSVPLEGFDWRIMGLLAFLIYFCVLFYVAIASRALIEKPDTKEKYKGSKLQDNEAMLLLNSLDAYMKNELPFTNQGLKLKDIAGQLQTSERSLSLIINKYKNQNFSDYINSFRIEYAIQLLSDNTLRDKTILWVLFEAGFNSKASFNTLFKKVVGCTPAEFRKASQPESVSESN